MRSLVEMGAAHLALGEPHFDEAERILLRIVDEPPGSDLLLTPSAPEFRDALFVLAELYETQGQPERVIARLEEVWSRLGLPS